MRVLTSLIALASAAASATNAAELRLPHLFSDGMVLQRDRPVPVWGWAAPSATVHITFNNQHHTTRADEHGSWSLTLDAMPAHAEPLECQIASGATALVLNNILIGEVVQISGQSNAAMSMTAIRRYPGTDADLAAGLADDIRLFQVPWSQFAAEPRDDVTASWITGRDQRQLPTWSALAFYMARELHDRLHVPIGIVRASHAGGMAEVKMPKEALLSYPGGRQFYHTTIAAYQKRQGATAPPPPATTSRDGELPPEPTVTGAVDGHFPAADWNGAIAPVIRYAKRAVVWYQGEHNAGKGSWAYRQTLPVLVQSWRDAAHDPQLPFIIVQLPRFEAPGWAMLRESQDVATRTIPNAALVVTLDLGEAQQIHPADKKALAARVTAETRRLAFHEAVSGCGPLFDHVDLHDTSATVHFQHVQGGLRTLDNGPVRGCTSAGDDGIFAPATATIHHDTLTITAPGIAHLRAVRYAWAAVPDSNLVDGDGLPVGPFRTDSAPE